MEPGTLEIIRVVIAVIGGISALTLGGYAAWKKTKAVGEKAVREEWRDLATVRAEKIEELEHRLVVMEGRISNLEGAYAALQDLKVNEIAARVVERLLDARVEYEQEGIQKFIAALKNAGFGLTTAPE